MLLINPLSERTLTHEASGATFTLLPIDPETYNAIRSKSLKQDATVDMIEWGENFADAAIKDWSGVGIDGVQAPCISANKRLFGRAHCLNIMPWIVSETTGLAFYKMEESASAKNV